MCETNSLLMQQGERDGRLWVGRIPSRHTETPHKDMFVLYLRKETASLCAENHQHCKFSTRRSRRWLNNEPQKNGHCNMGIFVLRNWGWRRVYEGQPRCAQRSPSRPPTPAPSPAHPPVATSNAGPICALVQGVTRAPPGRGGPATPPSNEAPLDNCRYYPLCLDLYKPFCYKPHQIGNPLPLRPAEVDASHCSFNRGLSDYY